MLLSKADMNYPLNNYINSAMKNLNLPVVASKKDVQVVIIHSLLMVVESHKP